jgi:hypothetical protein
MLEVKWVDLESEPGGLDFKWNIRRSFGLQLNGVGLQV